MTRLILLAFLILAQAMIHAEEISIGVSRTNAGPVTRQDIINILKCTIQSKEHHFKFERYPNLRGVNYVKHSGVDAYYPVYVNEKNEDHTLLPIYIDEILLISTKKIDLKQGGTIGFIPGEQENLVKKYPQLKEAFRPTTPKYLFDGLIKGRAQSIITYRSQIPRDFKLDHFHVRTMVFKDVGIQLSPKFEAKVKKGRNELQKNFIQCILSYDFKLTNIRKRAIDLAVKEDFLKLQKIFQMERVRVKNIAEKEKKWTQRSNKLISDILENTLSKKIETFTRKYPYINEAFIFNDQGALLGTLKRTTDFQQNDEEKYQVVKENKDFTIRNISNIYFDESSNSFQVGFTIRLEDKAKHFSGGLYIGADINKLFTYYRLN